MNKKGFSLVELLTVIIIIGVLASVALPQYQKVVEKGRFTRAEVMAKSLYDSCERLVSEWGVETYESLPSRAKKLSRLDIGNTTLLPTGFSLNNTTNTITGASFSYKLMASPITGHVGECYVRITKTEGTYSGVVLEYDGNSFLCSGDQAACDVYGLDYRSSLYGS